MTTPGEILERFYAKATKDLTRPAVSDPALIERLDFICRCLSNRAGVRLLMACMLAKIDRPAVDPRQPYTKIGGGQCFSGRTYDEQYITAFINSHRLPCNPTTAFLTPALRNLDRPLSTDVSLVGKPARMYADTLQMLDDVANGKVRAERVLTDTIRILVRVRDERAGRMAALLADLERNEDALPLASEAVVRLIEQHLACKNASRLPVLAVAAAYQAASTRLGEYARPLQSHNAADEQTGSLGDVEVCLLNEDRVVTIYEMKTKRVTIEDIDRAIQKIASHAPRVDNYVFITTDVIDDRVREYAFSMYEKTGGTEIALLDCIGFVRHFLHLFHRLRVPFLNAYQTLVLAQPESAVNQPLKEAFLSLRQAAEADA